MNPNCLKTNKFIDLLVLARPHQWIKNGFVLIGLLFGHAWNDSYLLKTGLIAFASFCLASSSAYVFNDMIDSEADSLHPQKKHRPLAARRVSRGMAACTQFVLVIGALGLSLMTNRILSLIILIYLLLNIAYSLKLKHFVLLDVFIIAIGFMLRILAGTLGIGIKPSHWLLLCGMMVTLFFGFIKRRSEFTMMKNSHSAHRQTLQHYSPKILDKMIDISAACIILSYSLYTMSPETILTHGTPNLIYTVPFVVYGIFRYIYLLHHKHMGADMARDIFRDYSLLSILMGWLLVTFWLIS